jgi:LCP family protein required for cell wall assembly
MKKIALILLVMAFLLSGCNAFASQQVPTTIPLSSLLLNEDPNLQPTRTPFQPIAPTPTKTPIIATATSAPTTQGDILQLYTQYPTMASQNIATPSGQIRILLLGSDYRPGRGSRTDVMILLTLNPSTGTATLLSFPRDLYVNIPGIGMERINTSQGYGDFALTTATFQQNFGFTPDYYVMTNFSGFQGIIDTLGGIEVNVGAPLTDKCKIEGLRQADGYCTIKTGTNYMDGETALWYVRSRYTSSDFDRTRRAQEVIIGIFQRLMKAGVVNKAPEIYNQLKGSVETNMPLETIISLLPLANQLVNDTSKIRRYAIGAAETYNYIVPTTGAYVLVPDQTAVMSIIFQALSE